MFVTEYYNSITDILRKVESDQLENIRSAGNIIAQSIAKDGLLYVFGCGHSHMIAEELFYRAGGLIAVCPIFEGSTMLHEGAVKSSRIERMSGYAPLVADQYDITPRDVLLIVSSSGINSFPIEMAEAVRNKGAKVIGITSLNYENEPSRERDGRHLSQVCDLCINNHVPCGDALVQVLDNGVKAGPCSSISSMFVANAVMLAACEQLKKAGIRPPVCMSGNVEGGDAYNRELIAKYRPRVKAL